MEEKIWNPVDSRHIGLTIAAFLREPHRLSHQGRRVWEAAAVLLKLLQNRQLHVIRIHAAPQRVLRIIQAQGISFEWHFERLMQAETTGIYANQKANLQESKGEKNSETVTTEIYSNPEVDLQYRENDENSKNFRSLK